MKADFGKLKLKSAVKVTKVLHKSCAKALKGTRVGDVLLLEIEVKNVTFGSSAGVYASYIDVTNLRTKNKEFISMTNFANSFFPNYEYEEVSVDDIEV